MKAIRPRIPRISPIGRLRSNRIRAIRGCFGGLRAVTNGVERHRAGVRSGRRAVWPGLRGGMGWLGWDVRHSLTYGVVKERMECEAKWSHYNKHIYICI